MKNTYKEAIAMAKQIGYIEGWDKGFDDCKKIYEDKVIFPKCFECNEIGDRKYQHYYGTEPACEKHANIDPDNEMIKEFPVRYKLESSDTIFPDD